MIRLSGRKTVMAKKLFIGNLAWEVAAEDLKEAFAKFGEVSDAFVAKDKFSGRSRGFGFVTFEDDAAADTAKQEMHDVELKGRPLMVDYATPRPEGEGNAPA